MPIRETIKSRGINSPKSPAPKPIRARLDIRLSPRIVIIARRPRPAEIAAKNQDQEARNSTTDWGSFGKLSLISIIFSSRSFKKFIKHPLFLLVVKYPRRHPLFTSA